MIPLVAAATWTIGNFGCAQQNVGAVRLVEDVGAVRLVEEDVRIPGHNASYTITAKILRPKGQGPYGAVVLNHGASVPEDRRTQTPELLLHTAAIFARRGYVVVLPLRRGFGATGGEFAESAGSCRNPDYVKGETNAAADIMAAYEYARTLQYVDPSRMILAGHSAGGVASLFAAGAGAPQGLVAVLAFAAGRGGNPARNPGVPCAVEPLARVFDELGKAVTVPVLFHYAENDQFFNPQTSRLWYERFSAGGARAEYVLQPAFGKDGHYIFSVDSGVRYWLPAVERFLAKHGVPFVRMQPGEHKPMLAGH